MRERGREGERERGREGGREGEECTCICQVLPLQLQALCYAVSVSPFD